MVHICLRERAQEGEGREDFSCAWEQVYKRILNNKMFTKMIKEIVSLGGEATGHFCFLLCTFCSI